MSTTSSTELAVGFVHTDNLPSFFEKDVFSLFVTTYQAQRLLLFTASQGRLSMLMRSFERPTGLAISGGQIALSAKNQLWIFADAGKVHDIHGNKLPHDAYFVPRRSHVTGDIAGHDLAWDRGELLVVNTRFSCLCKIAPAWSFVPVWKPKFISTLAAEDRCHLNGLAVDEKGPRYLTALSETDTKEGWRANKATTGVIIDFKSREVISRGMAMPHSPRIHNGKLWVLESGTGQLQIVDERSGKRDVVAQLPGYLRGLSFLGPYAFVGTSKIREKSAFGGMPIETRIKELKCSIQIVDTRTGGVAGFIEFTKGIEELFEMRVLPGARQPHILGFEEDTINGVYVLPPTAQLT